MITRKLVDLLQKYLPLQKALIILGPRQVGKTTLMKNLFNESNASKVWFNCDLEEDRLELSNVSLNNLKIKLSGIQLICIDEAQRVKNIGLTLKIIYDNFPEIQIVVTGSSALDIANEINEPLTGRKIELNLYPFSTQELWQHFGGINEHKNLEQRLIYGFYPEIVNKMENAPKLLSELTSSYLYKDIFMYEEIRSPEMLEKILKALAHQVGSLVSYNEIANLLKVSSKTVERYVKLLEQSFVIFRLPSYARNIRNELSKSQKIYFYDNGIRNALIGNFDSLAKRTDIGQLWENYLVSERKKFLNNNELNRSLYFWRTKQQQEIDLIELDKDEILAFEFKWQKALKSKIPITFTGAYPNHTFKAIDKENYWEFVM